MNHLHIYFSNLSPSTLDMDRSTQKAKSTFRYGRRLSGCGTTSTYDDSDCSTIASLDRKRSVFFSEDPTPVKYIPKRTEEENLDLFYDDYDMQAFRQELIEEKRAKKRPSMTSWDEAKKMLEQKQQKNDLNGQNRIPQKETNQANLERLRRISSNHWKKPNPSDEDDHLFLVGAKDTP